MPQNVRHSQQNLGENSPLLLPQSGNDDRDSDISTIVSTDCNIAEGEDAQEESKSMWYLFLLTISIGGLQIAWAVELSNGSPYLLSLGMSKALLALVWIAGPLSGTIVQPYIGIKSDNSRMSWGKRKPFMIGGAIATIFSLLALAWARDMMQGFLGLFGVDSESLAVKNTTIVFAIIAVFILDFAINTVQAAIRAFIVDNAPAHQQESANAWAGRMSGVGNVVGYLSGYVDLPTIFPIFGNTQFKVLCVIACLALGSTLLASCSYIKERDPRLEGPPAYSSTGVFAFVSNLLTSMKRLPPQVRKVCEVQLFAWIAWFPFLFYITTYIGQLYVNPILEANPHLTPKEIDQAWGKATRIGTFALFMFAITSLSSNIILPFLVVPTYRAPVGRPRKHDSLHRASTDSHSPLAQGATWWSVPSRLGGFMNACQIPGFTLRRAWFIAHLIFAACMLATFFISTIVSATILVAVVGLSWSLSLWAPFALISAEISSRDAADRRRRTERRASTRDGGDAAVGGHDQAGVILGIHNVSIAAPQIIATLVSSAIFKLVQRDRGVAGDESVAWVLRFGGLAALGAAYMTLRLAEEVGSMETSDETNETIV